MITFGTNPGMGMAVDAAIPADADPKALEYMGFDAGERLLGNPVDYVFVGSCTNGRIEDLRRFARLVEGRRKAPEVTAWIVPGSKAVEAAAKAEGLDRILAAAGFELRQPGCSACLAMNADKIPAGKYCVSTSNRNFEGRQGKGGRTHLVSPAAAAAAAITGKLTDPAMLKDERSSEMDKYTLLTTGAVALEADNIDTDQIMPKQFLRGIDKSGLDKGLFYNLKHKADGSLDPKCVLNSPAAAKAAVLLAGPNFGCGSSREHAVWGLLQGGFRVVVAPSFGEIFYSNCFNNGLLACKVSVDDLEKLFDVLRKDPHSVFTVDLAARTVCTGEIVVSFAIAPRHSRMLELGLDMVDTTLSEIDEVKRFREQHEREFPWMSGVPGKAKRVLVARGESLP